MELNSNSRRNFLGTLTSGAAVASFGLLPGILQAATPINTSLVSDAEEWLKKGLKGKHRVAYDGSMPHAGLPVIWTWAFYMTNNQTGVDDKNMTGMCVLRHDAIPFALKDELWAKYKLGEFFKITDNISQKPATRNTVYEPKDGDFPVKGPQGIKDLQARGAMFCVCDLALNVYSGFIASGMGMEGEAVYKEFVEGLHPGIQIVPSGVWALGRAQELGCGYIYAGG